jgi:hypothetical protein
MAGLTVVWGAWPGFGAGRTGVGRGRKGAGAEGRRRRRIWLCIK